MTKVTTDNLGAWVLKCNPKLTNLDVLLANGVRTWCVQENYRSALIAADQPVVLWITGPSGATPQPGIWATGHATGGTEYSPHGKLVMPLELSFLRTPVPREDIAGRLPDLEVIRQPHMANPSFATSAEYAVLQTLGLLPSSQA
ncbi:hypothetical protein [Kribbella flavida]|uniref:hypothetical protein n=1 Tax=Kribbella flavida TaxID=182640 RepID=UPI00019BDA90|nr:hypothetical protein [Kribbella flavida]